MKNNLWKAYFVACILAIASVGTSVATTTTNGISMPSTEQTLGTYLIKNPPVSQTIPEIWRDEFDKRSTIALSDTFGWQSTARWLHEADRGIDLNVSYANAGRSAMQHAALNSLRESIVKAPGVLDSKNWFENLIVGTFARTTEESIKPVGQTPIAAQMTWWDEMRSNGNLAYGFRPLDGYFYGSARFGRWFNGKPIGIALARCHYDPILLRSSVDGQVSFFLPYSSTLTFGSSYELVNLRGDKRELNWSVSVTHTVGRGWYEGVIFASLSTNDNEMLASTGWHKSF